MTKLNFLEVNRNFRSYYKTLRDVNYHLNNSQIDHEKIEAATKTMTKLIYDFIRTEGTTFKEMDQEIYEKVFQMFQDDFLRIIEQSGVNNVDFDEFAGLLDELLTIAYYRTATLQKVKTSKQINLNSIEEVDDENNDSENEVITEAHVQLEELIEGAGTAEETDITVIAQLTEDAEQVIESRNETYDGDDVFHYRPARRRFR